MMELSEKNLAHQKRHGNSSKVCYFVDFELFNNMLYLTFGCPVVLDKHILHSGYSESHAATIGSVLVTNVKTGARREGWDKTEVLSKFPWYFILRMSTISYLCLGITFIETLNFSRQSWCRFLLLV